GRERSKLRSTAVVARGCRAGRARLRHIPNHRVFPSGGWGCPSAVSKGGGRSRRRRPGDMEAEGHPRPVPRRRINGPFPLAGRRATKKPALRRASWNTSAAALRPAGHLILPSLYITCLRTTGSYFLISILPGVFFLFLSVV